MEVDGKFFLVVLNFFFNSSHLLSTTWYANRESRLAMFNMWESGTWERHWFSWNSFGRCQRRRIQFNTSSGAWPIYSTLTLDGKCTKIHINSYYVKKARKCRVHAKRDFCDIWSKRCHCRFRLTWSQRRPWQCQNICETIIHHLMLLPK